jgi:hypothetical protein
MAADVGAIGGSGSEEALVTTDATNRAETKDAEKPISDRTVRVMEGFGVAVRADFTV